MSYSKFNLYKYSNNDEGTFNPSFVEIPIDEDNIEEDYESDENPSINDESKRIITGIVLLAILVISFFTGPNVVFVLLALIAVIGAKEWHDLFNYDNLIPYPLLLYAGLAPAIVIYLYNPEKIYVPLLIFPIGLIIYMSTSLSSEVYGLIGSAYIFQTWFGVGLATVAYVLKVTDLNFALLTFLAIALADSVAYEIGRRFGTKKLAPNISPSKTVEGFMAALLVGTVFYTIVLNNYFLFPIIIDIVLASFLILFALFGDLFESKIKRSVNAKDSGDILPGHGGVLDRFDSYLFAFPYVTLIILVSNLISSL